MNYWIFKSEPTVFGIDHLALCPHQTTSWDGVRNFQARNMLRDDVRAGDIAFFYHSNAKPPGIVGMMTVTHGGHPDLTALDKQSRYYDARATKDHPLWYCVDVKFRERFPKLITLSALKANDALRKLWILRPGNRLSITPLTKAEGEVILCLR